MPEFRHHSRIPEGPTPEGRCFPPRQTSEEETNFGWNRSVGEKEKKVRFT